MLCVFRRHTLGWQCTRKKAIHENYLVILFFCEKENICESFSTDEYYDLNDQVWDIHTITGALKLFFRELSEPLFTFKLLQQFLDTLSKYFCGKCF